MGCKALQYAAVLQGCSALAYIFVEQKPGVEQGAEKKVPAAPEAVFCARGARLVSRQEGRISARAKGAYSMQAQAKNRGKSNPFLTGKAIWLTPVPYGFVASFYGVIP